MNMKSVVAVFVVLAINQIQAQFPVADKDGIQIDFMRRVDDSTATHQKLLNYAAKTSSHPQQIRPPVRPPAGEMAAEEMRPPVRPPIGMADQTTINNYPQQIRPPVRPPVSEMATEEMRPPVRPPIGMADQTTINKYPQQIRPPIRPPVGEMEEEMRPPVRPPVYYMEVPTGCDCRACT